MNCQPAALDNLIRPASRADLPELLIMLTAMLQELAASGEAYLTRLDEHWQGDLELKLKLALTDVGSTILLSPGAGFIALQTVRPFAVSSYVRAVGYIEMCWVDPVKRRQGLARALVRAAEDWFGDRGLDFVELHYLSANPTAAAFWQACGYEAFRTACRRQLG